MHKPWLAHSTWPPCPYNRWRAIMSDLAAGIVLWFTTDPCQWRERQKIWLFTMITKNDVTITNKNQFSVKHTRAKVKSHLNYRLESQDLIWQLYAHKVPHNHTTLNLALGLNPPRITWGRQANHWCTPLYWLKQACCTFVQQLCLSDVG